MVKILESNIAVIERDNLVCKWIEMQGRLDCQAHALEPFLGKLKEGDTAIDIGSFVGDTAYSLSKKVGLSGTVLAFEPNPEAYECLIHNTNAFMPNVIPLRYAIGDFDGTVELHESNVDANNVAAHYVTKSTVGNIQIRPLDSFMAGLKPISFIKIDTDGFEPNVLRGANTIIERYKPDLYIEICYQTLDRAGNRMVEIWYELGRHNYKWKPATVVPSNWNDAPWDIYCWYEY